MRKKLLRFAVTAKPIAGDGLDNLFIVRTQKKGVDYELSLVTEWLLCASSQISVPYFQLPVAGAEDPQYRERVYCYELYHRWRCHWSDGFPFSLSGEVDKGGHRLIRGNRKPDFLVHIPGQMTNLLIVEVKPANADRARMIDDLKKLTYFRRDLKDQDDNPANYYAAYFWLYGLAMNDWPNLRNELLVELQGSADFDRALVSCIVHEAPGVRALRAQWDDAGY
ncbi:MAG: hypothetical protein D4R81_07930 [Nitrospiraceae bacterium]|nr:MAG: hypothetical protein D4R81_07930 [Nitrospiraceae bacterium]